MADDDLKITSDERCPYCFSDKIIWTSGIDRIENSDEAKQHAYCLECGAKMTAIYEFVHNVWRQDPDYK